jgi:hypothetical protein
MAVTAARIGDHASLMSVSERRLLGLSPTDLSEQEETVFAEIFRL